MLFDPVLVRSLPLANRAVMNPMTRSRAVHAATPNALMATYYEQRATAGLIITEGTSPSPNGLGYARIPALYNDQHVRGWKLVTDAVHAQGGRIVVQLMHTGCVTHQANLPAGARVVSSVSGVCPGQMWTDAQGMQPHTEEQFLNANVNTRTDGYGGSNAGRNRFALEVARAAAQAIGAHRVGIRLSPHGVFNGTGHFPEADEQFRALAQDLSDLDLMYLHVLDHSALGAPPVPASLKAEMRALFKGPFILAGGFDRDSAEQALLEGRADLIGFGRPFLANPDLVARMMAGAALNAPDMSTFYTADAKGYTDYPALAA
ncbi:MAG: alkene reductase [Rubrivivax sp.]|nr:alkene reductase [Rubrivivax sp.]